MKRLLLIPTLLLLLGGCVKSDLTDDIIGANIEQSTPITIGTNSEGITRGTIVDSEADMGSVGVYCAYTEQDDWSSTSATFNRMENARFNHNGETLMWEYDKENNNVAQQPVWGHTSLSDKYTFYAYAPHSQINSNIVPAVEGAALKIDYTVPTNFVEQVDLMVASPRKDINPQVGGKVNLQFNHALAKVSFSVKGDPTLKVKSITLKNIQSKGTLTFDSSNDMQWSESTTTDNFTVSAGNSGIDDVNPSEDASQTITPNNGYLFMIPQNPSGKMAEITIVDINGEEQYIETYSISFPANQVWSAGESYNYDIKVSDGGIDFELPFVEACPDVSNCYMIDPTTTDEIIVPISEYISYFWTNYGATPEEQAYANLTAGELEANVIWYDTDSDPIQSVVIDNVGRGGITRDNITPYYPKFNAATSKLGMRIMLNNNLEGNVVIGVKKQGSDDYLWSWHLWITDYNPYTKENGTTYNITSVTGQGNAHTLEWMDRNIGARSTAYSREVGNLHYQWGRKDPMPVYSNTPILTAGACNSIVDAVKAPKTFFTGVATTSSTWTDWVVYTERGGSDEDHFWRDEKLYSAYEYDLLAAVGIEDEYDKPYNSKSIFDPSPLGFMVAGENNYLYLYNFLGNNITEADNCITYNKDPLIPIIFPASGVRSGGNGNINITGKNQRYWTGLSDRDVRYPRAVHMAYDMGGTEGASVSYQYVGAFSHGMSVRSIHQ